MDIIQWIEKPDNISFMIGSIVGIILLALVALLPCFSEKGLLRGALIGANISVVSTYTFISVKQLLYQYSQSSSDVVFLGVLLFALFSPVVLIVPVTEAYGRGSGLAVTLGATYGALTASWGNTKVLGIFAGIYTAIICLILIFGNRSTK